MNIWEIHKVMIKKRQRRKEEIEEEKIKHK